MTDTMRGLTFQGIREIGLVERDLPTAGPGEAIVKTTVSMTRTSDLHTVAGMLQVPEGLLLGHESVGTKADGVIEPLITY